VVVDDHDMGITHVIRGDDHLNNAFRQWQIYAALGWTPPAFAHIPLIHGPDGAKLSKRHGALGVEAYRDMGFLPEAMRNYLLRLGWAHGDDEIISTAQAIDWFSLEAVGRSAARFDMDKLTNLNAHYMRRRGARDLAEEIAPDLAEIKGEPLGEDDLGLLTAAMGDLKARAKTLRDLTAAAAFYFRPRPLPLSVQARAQLEGENRARLADAGAVLARLDRFTAQSIETALRRRAEETSVKLGKLAQPLRAALTGETVSPPIFQAAALLGREETLARIEDALARIRP